jgi:hypothetical protein
MILEPLDLTTFAITIHPNVPFANVNLLHFSFQWHKLLLLSSFYCLHSSASCSFYFSIQCKDHYSTNHHQPSLNFFLLNIVFELHFMYTNIIMWGITLAWIVMQESGNVQGFERMCKVSFIVGTPLVLFQMVLP